MWVWQSHAPAGTSKFTAVAGCEAFANADPARMANPIAATPSSKARRVGMAFSLPRSRRCGPILAPVFCLEALSLSLRALRQNFKSGRHSRDGLLAMGLNPVAVRVDDESGVVART